MSPSATAENRKSFGFSARDYRALLQAFAERNYRTVLLPELQAGQRHLFLRHDVDLCLKRALAIAEIEAAEGARATYYVLVSTAAYNPGAAESRRTLGRLVELGHSVGLHFDGTAYSDRSQELEAHAAKECEILELLSGAPVTSISFHRPAKSLLGLESTFAGRPHSYQPRFTVDIGYVSDSSGGFFHGHPLDHPAVRAGRALQLLTHPIWWASDSPRTADEQLEEWQNERTATLKAIAAAATAKASSRSKPAKE